VALTTSIDAKSKAADSALLRRMVEGDETALAVLYDRYSGLVFSVAKRILGDRGAAEEILQDIFYQAWRTASSFDSSRGSLAGWLLVAARNRAIDQLRRRHGITPSPIREDSIAFALNLEDSATQNVMLSKVRKTFAELPEAQRTALELAYFEGLTHREIAERTGEPLGTIKTRLRAALGSLKKVFQL
jgi:RNA polymerase sigma-70 factor, ECF subfamily